MGRFLVAAILVVLLSADSLQAQKIYFFEDTTNKIRRVDPNGSNLEDVVDTSPFGPWAIAADPLRGRLYWTDLAGDLYRAGFDGSNRELIPLAGEAVGVGVDLVRAKLYWTFGLEGFPNGVARSDLDGSNSATIYENSNNQAPERVAFDLLDGKLYWTEARRVLRTNLDGANLEILVTTSLDQPSPFGIAIDPIRRMLYWTAITGNGPGKIQRSTLEGQQIQDVATLAPNTLAEIGIDPYAGKIYWTDAYVIRRANLDGTNVEHVTDTNLPYGGPIALDAIPPPIPTASTGTLVAMFILLLIAGGVVLGGGTVTY